jgi:rubredoxin
MIHKPVECKRVMGVELRYSFKNWSDKFVCPACGKSKRQSLNFLGSRVLVCDGESIRVVAKGGLR